LPEVTGGRNRGGSFVESLGHAWSGLLTAFQVEPNMRLHLAMAMLVIVAGHYWGLSPARWTVLYLAIGLVMASEVLNSAIERVVDLTCEGQHRLAAEAKNLGAGAVLLAALVSVAVGYLLFIGPLWQGQLGGGAGLSGLLVGMKTLARLVVVRPIPALVGLAGAALVLSLPMKVNGYR